MIRSPLIALVGRPNVGKSELFNRIIKKRKAIVEPVFGTTRDRIYSSFSWQKKEFEIVDTGGLTLETKERMKALVRAQTERAIEEADILFFVCDAKDGSMPLDSHIAQLLRASGKQVFLVVNKADNETLAQAVNEFYGLGFDRPYPVSALSGFGIKELLDAAAEKVTSARKMPIAITARLAIVGKPNVGKSSFLNAILQEERVIVDEKPGTTRDAVDTYFRKGNDHFILIDTAGIRRPKKIKEPTEIYSMARTKHAIERCDCSLLLVDAACGITTDEMSIIGRITSLGKGVVLVVNKWDLVKGVTMNDYERSIRSRLAFFPYVPVVFASAKTRMRIEDALDAARGVVENSARRIGTSLLCKMLQSAQNSNPHPFAGGRRVRFYYMTQVGVRPPEFAVFTNHPDLTAATYSRYLEKRLRQLGDFSGTPIQIEYRLK